MFFERVIFSVAVFCGIVVIFAFLSQRAFKSRTKMHDKFLEEEQAANSARTRAIEPHFYFKPDIKKLPFRTQTTPELTRKQQNIQDLSTKRMINFGKKLTNTELKHLYGVANLEKIIQQEGFFNNYVQALVDWGDSLMQAGHEADAVAVLEESLHLNSEYRKTYLHLADYYAKRKNYQALESLIEKIAALFSDEVIKKQLINYVMDKRE